MVPNSVSFSKFYVWYHHFTFSVRRQTCYATSSSYMTSCVVHKVQIYSASLNCINKKKTQVFFINMTNSTPLPLTQYMVDSRYLMK